MKVVSRNVDLPISKIYPHPDNPRKDVGDVSELAKSIKANGIFQNLTVVGGGKGAPTADDYTVIIGHRRLSAAKQAGLKQVPCMVVEMDEREQAATMLLENMQRSDLTIYEQAQGFQMMLDLGETQDGIAEKTGFSKSTIRHRLKLLELDQDELRKAQERQATFSDYIELERIKDPKSRNEALKQVGTSNFKWTVDRLVRAENAEANAKATIALLDSKFKHVAFDKRFSYRQISSMPISSKNIEENRKTVEELIDKNAKYYTLSSDVYEFAWAYIYADAKMLTEEEKAAEAALKEKENRRVECVNKISKLEEQAAELRKAFVKKYANREHIEVITRAFLTESNLDDICYSDVADMLYLNEQYEKFKDLQSFLNCKEYRECVKKHPESVMLTMLCTIYEGAYRTTLHDYYGSYCRNTRLENWYALLTRIGYKMSSDERKLLSGTHECFGGERNE